MHRVLKSLLFLLILVLLDSNILCIKSGWLFSVANAEESKTIDIKAPVVDPGGATFPQCGSDVVLGLAGLVAAAIAGIALIVASLTSGVGAGLAVIGVGVIAGGIAGAMQLIACLWSFVRNPVLRDEDGNYRYCETLEYIDPANQTKGKFCKGGTYKSCSVKSTDAIAKENEVGCIYSWPRNKTAHGEYIEVCYRDALGAVCTDLEECKKKLDHRELAFKSINLGVFGQNESLEEVINMKAYVGNNLTCKTIKNGESTTIGPYKYYANYEGNYLCAYVKFTKKSKIGCQLRSPVPPSAMCPNSVPQYKNGKVVSYDNSRCFNCYISPMCYGQTGALSHAKLSMTSLVVQCIQDSLKNLLLGECNNVATKEGFLIIAQKRLKNAVQAVILLAIILFGFKLMMGAVQGLQEWGMFIIKVALILYFTVGDGMIVYYDQLIKLSTGIADIVQSAGGNQTICDFKASDYNQPTVKSGQVLGATEKQCYSAVIASGNTNDPSLLQQFIASNSECNGVANKQDFVNKLQFKSFAYLALWDRLDCRMSFYMGQSLRSIGATGGGVAAFSFGSVALIVFAAILAFLFAGQIVIAIVLLVYIILLMLVIVWITHLFILSVISLTIIILFSPIFIPLCLFQVTKSFFDGWLKELMSYSIYPLVLFGFLSLMFSVLDKLYFEDLEFKRVVSQSSGFRAVYDFELKDPDQCKKKNAKGELRSGSVLACIIQNISFKEENLLFGIKVNVAESTSASTATVWQKVGMMALMCFLFYHFLGILGGLAAELVGNFRADLSRHTSGPQQMMKKAMAAGVKAGKAMATGGKSLASEVKSAVGNKARGGAGAAQGGSSSTSEESGGSTGGSTGEGG